MDAYTPDAWGAAFAAVAGASAALTGRLFVALSINLDRVIKVQGLIGRAVEVLLLLGGVLIVATLLLMPGQGAGSAAAEILAVGITLLAVLAYIHLRALRKILGVTGRKFAMRVLGAQLGPVLLVVGG